jgi:hypothetical protein
LVESGFIIGQVGGVVNRTDFLFEEGDMGKVVLPPPRREGDEENDVVVDFVTVLFVCLMGLFVFGVGVSIVGSGCGWP